ncbi:hypothetical protein HA466_0252940 [Hirschfeldia incana]|nr:hypothetical protein HA466_0252940 [Hirschfeldia incana]
MESGSVSAINQALPTSGDEQEKFTVYSTAVHKAVFMINVVVLGLLQLMSQQSSVLKTHKPTLICFCLLIFFYAVLRVREAIDVNRRFGVIARLVGYTSHLLGGLAASVITSVVCTELAFVLLTLWCCWFSFVVYNTLNEIKINNSRENSTGADSPGSSPV